jgi:hypothetical protein
MDTFFLVIAAAMVVLVNLAGRLYVRQFRQRPAQRATLGLKPGEDRVWSRRVVSPVGRLVAVIGACVLGGALVAGNRLFALVGAALLLLGFCLSEISVTIDQRGLTIAYTPLRWPVSTLPLDRIDVAERIDMTATYLGVQRRWGATAVLMRSGEAIRVLRHDGRVLIVSVPDADTAAALLNDLSAPWAPSRGP